MKSTNDITCDWCDRTPKLCFEARKKKRKEGLVPTNLWFYSCYVHRKALEFVAEEKHGEIIYVTDKVVQKGY